MVSIFFLSLSSCLPLRDRSNAFDAKGIVLISEDSAQREIIETEATENSNNFPTDINSDCSFSSDGVTNYKKFDSHIGYYNICQSINDSKLLYLQVQTPTTDIKLCLIPTYQSSQLNSGSVYIGEPRCVLTTSATAVYPINMLINRTNFQTYPMNSLMIMKDEKHEYGPPFGIPYQNILSPDAYLYCSWQLSVNGDGSFCEAFKTVGAYIYHIF